MLTVHLNYVKERANIFKLLSLSDGRIGRQRQLKRLGRQPRPRRFWVRPGRTSAWWDNFVGEIVIQEEWRENFRMSRSSLCELADQLRPYIEGRTTIMRAPVDVVKQVVVAIALEVLYSIVTLSSNSTSSSVQTKESAAFLSVFFGFCFDFDILKLIFKWKSTKRINKADFPPHRALYGACSEDILLQRDPGH